MQYSSGTRFRLTWGQVSVHIHVRDSAADKRTPRGVKVLRSSVCVCLFRHISTSAMPKATSCQLYIHTHTHTNSHSAQGICVCDVCVCVSATAPWAWISAGSTGLIIVMHWHLSSAFSITSHCQVPHCLKLPLRLFVCVCVRAHECLLKSLCVYEQELVVMVVVGVCFYVWLAKSWWEVCKGVC